MLELGAGRSDSRGGTKRRKRPLPRVQSGRVGPHALRRVRACVRAAVRELALTRPGQAGGGRRCCARWSRGGPGSAASGQPQAFACCSRYLAAVTGWLWWLSFPLTERGPWRLPKLPLCPHTLHGPRCQGTPPDARGNTASPESRGAVYPCRREGQGVRHCRGITGPWGSQQRRPGALSWGWEFG